MRSLLIVFSVVVFSPGFADSGECSFLTYQTRGSACSGGASTQVNDGNLSAANAAACAAMCGCKPNPTTGRTWRYNCYYFETPR